MDPRLSITGPADLRRSDWVRLDNARPRCPCCHTGMPLQFEIRVEVYARSVSRMGTAIHPSDGHAGDSWYYQTHLHKQCKRVIEIRLRDPAILVMKAAA